MRGLMQRGRQSAGFRRTVKLKAEGLVRPGGEKPL